MQYALQLAQDGRVLSVTFPDYAAEDAVCVTQLPEGDVANYRFEHGVFLYDPLPVLKQEDTPSILDRLEAQLIYTAMMTDTLLEEISDA